MFTVTSLIFATMVSYSSIAKCSPPPLCYSSAYNCYFSFPQGRHCATPPRTCPTPRAPYCAVWLPMMAHCTAPQCSTLAILDIGPSRSTLATPPTPPSVMRVAGGALSRSVVSRHSSWEHQIMNNFCLVGKFHSDERFTTALCCGGLN